MKYKVGDKVRVRAWADMAKDAESVVGRNIGFRTTACLFNAAMERFCGKVFTIYEITDNDDRYLLEGCNPWCFVDEMLEPATKYKAGDKVRVREWDDMAKDGHVDSVGDIMPNGGDCYFVSHMRKYCGKVFTVKAIVGNTRYLLHDTAGWHFTDEMLEPADCGNKIVIKSDGVTTTAKMYDAEGNLIKDETAKCHESDTFNFETGAKLAFARLMGEKTEAPKKANGRKFKIGDRVIGNDGADKAYSITVKGWRGIVVQLCDNGMMRVESAVNGIEYRVDEKHFDFDTAKKSDLKPGDRVMVIDVKLTNDEKALIGEYGTVRYNDGDIARPILVEFDRDTKDVYMHSGNGRGKEDHCRYMESESLMWVGEEVVEDAPKFKEGDKVVFTNNDPVMKGRTGTVICKMARQESPRKATYGVAVDGDYKGHHCRPQKLEWGKPGKDGNCRWVDKNDIELKVELITGYTGKVVCIKKKLGFSVGKVYEFVNGRVKDDDGDTRPGGGTSGVDSLDSSYFTREHFIPFVE